MQPLTDEQAEALARRLVACKVWRWLPGMRTLDSDDAPAGMVVYVGDGLLDVYGPDSLGYMDVVDVDAEGLLPDLRDPATRGCVLQLVRDAWHDQTIGIVQEWSTGRPLWRPSPGRIRLRDVIVESEVEALVAAMEAAP